ncbi:uncharacterized protein [Dysidea avara]|uniref:uncharacterized protein n=1 Tax=Dysidea avara TaxID=196820 RepID=UPI00331E38A9
MVVSEADLQSLSKRKPTKKEKDDIATAAGNGDVSSLQELYTSGVDVTGDLDDSGWTGLHWAASSGQYSVASTLINWGVEVNVATFFTKRTPLHYAANSGSTGIVTLLVDHGANVNVKDLDGNTPLVYAVDKEHSMIVYSLIREVRVDPTQCPQELQQKIPQLLEEEESRRRGNQDQLNGSHDPQQGAFTEIGCGTITKRTIYAYRQAMRKGTRASNQLKLVMIGPEGAGKTSTIGSLLEKQFLLDQQSTVGASINTCTVERIFASEWRQSEIKDQLEHLPNKFRSRMRICVSEIARNIDDKKVAVSNSISNRQEEIPKEIPKEIVARVQEVVQAKEVSDRDIRIIVLDLGGQEIYYEIHFMFLAPDDVVLMTFDAKKGLDHPVISRQRLNRFQEKIAARGMQTNLEVLEALFQAIYGHCGVEVKGDKYISKRIPTILMIATHAKGLTDQQKREIELRFYKVFSGKTFMDHLPKSRADSCGLQEGEGYHLKGRQTHH